MEGMICSVARVMFSSAVLKLSLFSLFNSLANGKLGAFVGSFQAL